MRVPFKMSFVFDDHWLLYLVSILLLFCSWDNRNVVTITFPPYCIVFYDVQSFLYPSTCYLYLVMECLLLLLCHV